MDFYTYSSQMVKKTILELTFGKIKRACVYSEVENQKEHDVVYFRLHSLK